MGFHILQKDIVKARNDDISIKYWDANNLYELAIIQDLSYEGFKFLSEEEIKRFNLDGISENSKNGYIL